MNFEALDPTGEKLISRICSNLSLTPYFSEGVSQAGTDPGTVSTVSADLGKPLERFGVTCEARDTQLKLGVSENRGTGALIRIAAPSGAVFSRRGSGSV